ncbi:MAG: DNA polymerase III subunit alpha [Solirubrobacterales bacterium]
MDGFPSPPLFTEPSPGPASRRRIRAPRPGPVPYVELHAHSAFSFLDGASLPVELAASAAELGYPALALTDHDGVWGSMEFAHACKPLGVHPITGAELTISLPGEPPGAPGPRVLSRIGAHHPCGAVAPRGGPSQSAPPAGGAAPEGPPGRAHAGLETAHVTLLVEDAKGYRNLCRLLTEAHAGTREGAQSRAGQPWVSLQRLEERSEGLVCLSGCAREGAVAGRWERGEGAAAEAVARRLLAAFGPERFRVELQRPYWRRDRARSRWLSGLAETLGVPAVATGNVHCHDRSRVRLQDALVAVRLGTTLEGAEAARRGNSSCAMASPAAMAERFCEHPEAVRETLRLAERLQFDLTRELGYRYPGAEDRGADRRLAVLCRDLLESRYAGSPDRGEAERRLDEELGIIRRLGLSGFFLLHRELLELAREVAAEVRGPGSVRAVLPPGRGRGSSVSSIVCHLTGLSHVDPVKARLFTGRFLNDEVTAVPDIDLDFPRDIRERLIPRVHERYGAERSALVAAFPTYRSRGAVRDLGKALGLPGGEIERAARAVDFHGSREEIEGQVTAALGARRAGSVRWRRLVELCGEALGLPRHPSQHPGGMVISTRPLVEMCPAVPAAMEGRQIAQWDKDSCADAGFLKIDLLGLGMLSAVERCVEEIERVRGERIDLSRIPLDDSETFASIRRSETTGVFQIESRAQMQMLPRTLPRDLDDLTVQVALVRPGPIQGGAIHPYIERRRLLREDPGYRVPYDHPSLEPVLRETLGAIVFQEQVIEVAMALAGFSSGEAEGLRRAMSRKRSEAALRAYHERFVEGAVTRGVSRTVAEKVYRQIQGFSGFGFPKAHSVAFGLLAYQSAWLRVHYGPEFLASLLNEQPMGFYPPDSLVHEAQRRGIPVLSVDVNRSHVLCRAEPGGPPGEGAVGVRVGLAYVKGAVEAEMAALVSERERGGPYEGIADLASRSGVSRDGLERLAWAGAVDGIGGAVSEGRHSRPGEGGGATQAGGGRRRALWRLGVAGGGERLGSGTQLPLPMEPADAPDLPRLGRWERLLADYGSTGMTLGDHPMGLLRGDLPGVRLSSDLPVVPEGTEVEVAGLVVARQRPGTAKGVVFVLLEDEEGTVNVILPPPVFERFRSIARTAPLLRARGRLERRQGAINVVASVLGTVERPDQGPPAEVLEMAERRLARSSGEQGAADDDVDGRAAIVAELRAVAPAAHSFGRRGR